jgi:S1-C subfamily serine protease
MGTTMNGYPYPPAPYALEPAPAAPPRGRRGHARLWKVGAGVTAIVAVATFSFAAGSTVTRHLTSGSASAGSASQTGPSPFGTSDFPNTFPYGDGSDGSSSSGGSGGWDGSSSSGTDLPDATADQQVGVVDITTTLGYQGARAAGTGLVLDSSGDILTNNHVIDGATAIRVTVVSTGRTYSAKVVGTAPTEDIAVIRLTGASGLTTANFGDSDTVRVGQTVIGVGNAGGVGGTPSAATGTVLALGQSITASDDGANAERLPDVIVSTATIQAGDAGGPLFNTADQVVGIDTAASTSGTAQGFSIPIDRARSVAGQILAGNETTSIHIGYPAFLGVSIGDSATRTGALVAGVLDGTPAASSGMVAGDRITEVGSTSTPTSTALRTAMSHLEPGKAARVTYVTQNGGVHHVTLPLIAGPAD